MIASARHGVIAINPVIPIPTENLIISIPAIEGIVATLAINLVISIPTGNLIISIPAIEGIVAAQTVDQPRIGDWKALQYCVEYVISGVPV